MDSKHSNQGIGSTNKTPETHSYWQTEVLKEIRQALVEKAKMFFVFLNALIPRAQKHDKPLVRVIFGSLQTLILLFVVSAFSPSTVNQIPTHLGNKVAYQIMEFDREYDFRSNTRMQESETTLDYACNNVDSMKNNDKLTLLEQVNRMSGYTALDIPSWEQIAELLHRHSYISTGFDATQTNPIYLSIGQVLSDIGMWNGEVVNQRKRVNNALVSYQDRYGFPRAAGLSKTLFQHMLEKAKRQRSSYANNRIRVSIN